MNEIITTTDMMDKLDGFVPELLKMRERIDAMILGIKMFKQTNGVGSDRTKVNVILNTISTYFDITVKEIKGRSREGDVRKGRQIYCKIARDITELSFQAIGDHVDRDHATVRHGCIVIEEAGDTGDVLYDHYQVVKKNVLNALDAI